MANDHTAIEWTDATWSPVVGCEHVSAGCDNCYAATLTSGRLAHLPAYSGLAMNGRFTGEVRLLPERLDQPLKWRKPRRIFVNSMSDLFHKDIPDEYIARVFATMAAAPRHTFQVLTKRHARMRSLLSDGGFQFRDAVWEALCELIGDRPAVELQSGLEMTWPLPNVWLGVSVENQQWADIRIPALLDTPAAVRFLSCEPLLGPVDLRAAWIPGKPGPYTAHDMLGMLRWPDSVGVNWVIVGGESGRGARPMHPDWARSLRDQCVAAGVPFHFKQRGQWTWTHNPGDPWDAYQPEAWVHADTGQVMAEDDAMADGGPFQGVWRVGKKAAGRRLDGRTWDEFPEVSR